MYVVGKRVFAQCRALGVEGAGDRFFTESRDVLAVFIHRDLHQPARRVVQAFVHIHRPGHSVGAGHRNGLLDVCAVFLDQAPAGRLHHAVKDFVRLLPGQDSHRLVVHAQQQGHDLPHAAAVQGGQLGCCRRAGQRVAHPCHGHRRRRTGRGRHGGDPACSPAGVDPDRFCTCVIIVHVIRIQLRRIGLAVVPVDRGWYKGQALAAGGHKGAFETAEQDGRGVQLAVRHREAQRRTIDAALRGRGRQCVVKQHRTVRERHRLALLPAEVRPQAEAAGFVQLRRREAAAEGGHIVAQQLEHGGAGFFQRHAVVRAERAVGVAAQPPLLDGDPDIGCPAVVRRHIREEFPGGALRGNTLPVGGKGRQ